MATIPVTEETPVIRVDYSDEGAWEEVRYAIQAPVPFGDGIEFRANVTFIEDKSFDSVDVERLLEAVPADEFAVILVVDLKTIRNDEHPVLCIDVAETPGSSFRFIPSESWSVENNLSLGNMDFEEFKENCEADGVFRGIPI